MTMVKPIGKTIKAFDSSSAQLFEFISRGGNQVVKNRIIIILELKIIFIILIFCDFLYS